MYDGFMAETDPKKYDIQRRIAEKKIKEERTADFVETAGGRVRKKVDHATGRKSAHRRRDTYHIVAGAVAREKRDRLAAEGAVGESLAVFPETKEPLGVNEELEKKISRGEFAGRGISSSEDVVDAEYWNMDVGDDGEERFANPEAEAEFQRYLEEQVMEREEEADFDQTDREMRRPEIKLTSQRVKHVRG